MHTDGASVGLFGASYAFATNTVKEHPFGQAVVLRDTIVWSLQDEEGRAVMKRSNGRDFGLREADKIHGLTVIGNGLAAVWRVRPPFTITLYAPTGERLAVAEPVRSGAEIQVDTVGLVAASVWSLGCGLVSQFITDLRGTGRWMALAQVEGGKLHFRGVSDFPAASGVVGYDRQRRHFVVLQDTGRGVDVVTLTFSIHGG